MATTKTKKDEIKEEKMDEELEEKTQAAEPENSEETEDKSDNQGEPEKKESRWDKVKTFGKEKVIPGLKKAGKAAGLIAIGAGATLGVLAVMTKPDGTEYEPMLPKDDDLIPADDFIDGEAEVVDASEGTEE